MIQRVSQGVQLGTAGDTKSQQSSTGYVGPDTAKFQTSHNIQTFTSAESAGDRMLGNILGAAGKLASQKVEQSMAEAYLDGVAKAGTIQSEAELDGNIITRDWQTAGYRDTMGKLASADAEANTAEAMHTMREQSPERFSEYLAEQRGKLLPQLEGMSLSAKKSMLAQVMLNERAAIKKHGAEHYSFIMEQKQKATQIGFNAHNAAMSTAKLESPDGSATATYDTAVSAAFGYVHGVFTDESLPPNVKGKLLTEIAQAALSDENNNQLLYSKMKETNVQWPDGSSHPMTDAMSWEDNVKLGKEFKESEKRTEHFRTTAYGDKMSQMLAGFNNPDVPRVPVDEVRRFIDEGTRQFPTYITQAKRDSFMEAYYSADAKKSVQTNLSTYFATGNVAGMHGLDKTPSEALNAWKATTGKNMSPEAAHSALIGIGLQSGMAEAFREAGAMMAPAIMQLSMNDQIDPTNAKMVANAIKTMDSAEQGHLGALQQYVAGLQPEAQSFLLDVRSNLKITGSPSQAVQLARKTALDTAALSGPQRAALAGASSKDDIAALAEITPVGLWGAFKESVAPFVPGMDANKGKLTVRQGWRENSEAVEASMYEGKVAVAKEMEDIARARPYSSAESRMTMAVAAVANRTVTTQWGPLVIPKGRTIQQVFGVNQNVQHDRVANAMNELIPDREGQRVAFQFGANGELMYQYRSKKDGAVTAFQTIDPKMVSQVVKEQELRKSLENKLINGEGTVRKMGDASVQFNGDNTAGADNAWQYRFRNRLVDHEGVKSAPYSDLSGKKLNGASLQTVGVGVTQENSFYPKPGPDGKITQAQLDESFKLASNEAAQAGMRIRRKVGLPPSEPAFQFMAELAYQAGPEWDRKPAYKDLIIAMRNGDEPAAQAALQGTPAWRMSGDGKRREFYRNSLKQFMR